MIKFIQKLATKNIFLVCGIIIIITILLNAFMACIVIPHLPHIQGISSHTTPSKELRNYIGVLLDIPVGAIFEEILFRLYPMLIWMVIMISSYAQEKSKNIILIIIMIVSSILFGWIHGNIYNVLMQGMSGFFFFITFLIGYLKVTKDMYSENNELKGLSIGLLTSSVCHMTFNWIVICI